MKRLLVTGASGLVGGYLIQQADDLWEIHGTYHKHPVAFNNAEMHCVSMLNEQSIVQCVRSIKPEVIIHTAAWTDVNACERDPQLAYDINAEATAVIAREASRMGARMISLSSDMVFDGRKGLYVESDPVHPLNHYGITKLAGEKYVLDSVPSSVVARVALIYGKPLGEGNSFSERILQKIRKGDPVYLYTDQYRSPVWVADLSRALLELANHEFCGIIHLGGADRVDRYQFGLLLVKKEGFSPDCLYPVSMFDSQTAAERPQDVSFCIRQAQSILKTKLVGYREGINHMYRKFNRNDKKYLKSE